MARRLRQLGSGLTGTSGMPPALRCRGLRVALGGRQILDGVDLAVDAGESVAIVGPSGSGKTTLLHCLAGLIPGDEGAIEVRGRAMQGRRAAGRARIRAASIGIVFQFGELFEELTVGENVALPLRLAKRPGKHRASEVLAQVGLADRQHSFPADLSGGEAQRVAIARALVGRPALLLADEPTGALDEDLSSVVCEVLIERARRIDAALVVATHDPLVQGLLDRSLRLRRGALVPT